MTLKQTYKEATKWSDSFVELFNHLRSQYGNVRFIVESLSSSGVYPYYLVGIHQMEWNNGACEIIVGYDNLARSTSEDGFLDLDVKEIIISTEGNEACTEETDLFLWWLQTVSVDYNAGVYYNAG